MDDLFFPGLKMQNYLKLQNISVEQAKAIFSFRTRTAQFSENYKNDLTILLVHFVTFTWTISQCHSITAKQSKKMLKSMENTEIYFLTYKLRQCWILLSWEKKSEAKNAEQIIENCLHRPLCASLVDRLWLLQIITCLYSCTCRLLSHVI